MDSNITASLIGVGGGFIASIITFYLGRFYEGYDQRKLEKELKKDSIYRERSSEKKEDYEFIFSLPNLKQETYLSCHINWDTGITTYMVKGNDDLIWFLRYCWLSLSRFFPDNHFNINGHNSYIDHYILERIQYHYSRLDVMDTQRSGTISKVLLGSAVAKDLDILIVDLVDLILSVDEERKPEWFISWNQI